MKILFYLIAKFAERRIMQQTLTLKQNKFVNKYLECGNASEAYRFAYSCANMKDETINRKAIEVLQNGKVAARIKELQARLQLKSDLTKERVLFELECIIDAQITDYLDFTGSRIKFKPFSELTQRQVKAIESIKKGRNGIELKLHGKSWSIERICKMLGYDAPEKLEHMGKDGKDLLPTDILDKIPDTVLNDLYKKLKDGEIS
ncbi:MAG: terminase small subunit [Porphyromonadaceae bacterium]|nr:terminase small subunit [Porphyromonadaceae bacterium]